jgi:surfeit locus 1 family protein
VSSHEVSASAHRRKFRPKPWALLLTIVFSAVTVRLGHWQGERAQYKIEQQTQLNSALAAPPLKIDAISSDSKTGTQLRYRSVVLNGAFLADELLYVDNRIIDGKAGYGLLQSFRADATNGASRTLLVDRGWMRASGDRTLLPVIDTPRGQVTITGRINLPPSRNPGTFDNNGGAGGDGSSSGKRLNYVNIAELSQRFSRSFEPFVVEQTAGPGFHPIERPMPGANFEKNRGYQLQWYGFAALSIIIFLVLSFRKVDAA